MSLTAFDGIFSWRQNELATKGIRVPERPTEEQFERWKQSDAAKLSWQQFQDAWSMTCDRDRRRAERDPTFRPSEADFTAAKAFDYDKEVNYYTILGVGELAPLDDIKRVYKKLSLLYHPDKSMGLPHDQQEEHAAIFLELKAAYLTLGDQATRRQYDRDRDSELAGARLNGSEGKPDKPSFAAAAVLERLSQAEKPEGKQHVVEVFCKLEKFFYGGMKVVRRKRRVIRDGEVSREDAIFRLDVPRGAQERCECVVKGGDENWDAQPDTFRFVLQSKTHGVVERDGYDLRVREPVLLQPDAHLQPTLTAEVRTVGGRCVLLWGRNPLYSQPRAVDGRLQVRILGEGIGPSGSLHFTAEVGEGRFRPKVENNIVVTVRIRSTRLEFFCVVQVGATIGHLKQAVRGVLDWPDSRTVDIGPETGAKAPTPFQRDGSRLGDTREVVLVTRDKIYEVPMSVRRARELLATVSLSYEQDWIQPGADRQERTTVAHWELIARLAPFYGYNASLKGLGTAVQRALWMLREEPDGEHTCSRFAQLGFQPRKPPQPRVIRRRALPQPPMVLWLARNGLGPPKWAESESGMPDPGSETDSTEAELNEDVLEAEGELAFPATISPGACASNARHRARRVHGTFGVAVHPEMMKRAQRRARVPPACALELAPLPSPGQHVQLLTKPPCSLSFYASRQVCAVEPGRLQPEPMFAVAVCCPSGIGRAGREAWLRLKRCLVPLLEQTVFLMLAEARHALPRPLLAGSAFPDGVYAREDGVRVTRPGEESEEGSCSNTDADEAADAASAIHAGGARDSEEDRIAARRRRRIVREVWRRDQRMQARRSEHFKAAEARALAHAGEADGRGAAPGPEAVFWKRQATQSFKHGDFHLAQMYYSRELESLQAADEERLAVAHSNKSACLVRVGHFGGALQAARRATELRPSWGRAWARVAAAAKGLEELGEARAAWFQAVVCDPNAEHVEGLAAAYRGERHRTADLAHERKERGNEAARSREWGTAVAHFTVGIAMAPSVQLHTMAEDEFALLRSVLYANRSAMFSRARLWQLAVADGWRAVEHKGAYAGAHCRLGVAQLGCQMNEHAYRSFAMALTNEESNRTARRGREVCLGLIPHWVSQAAQRREGRFLRDAHRPFGTTRVYAVSDVHFDHQANEEWAHSIHATKFLDDVLVVAGNLGDSYRAVQRGLTALRAKFRRVFYLPGNHEMWITTTERKQYPDSLCKLWHILDLCDDLDVDTGPAAVCRDLYIVPLFSWYNATLDSSDPFPNPKSQADKYAKWPIDKHQQVWRYMLALNRTRTERRYPGTVITFSHFVPRSSCPVPSAREQRKTSGCPELDEQVRLVGSSCHVYGHTGFNHSATVDGVAYVHRPLFTGSSSREPILCIFHGGKVSHELTAI